MTLAFSELAFLASVQFIPYAVEGLVLDYYVCLMCFDRVGVVRLFLFFTYFLNVQGHFQFYKIAEKLHKEPVFISLPFQRVTEIDWSSSGRSDSYLSYDFVTGTVQAISAAWHAPVKRQKVDAGPMALVSIPAVDVSWFPGVACKTNSDIRRDYRWLCGINDGEKGLPAEVAANLVDDLGNISAQVALWEGHDGFRMTPDYKWATTTTMDQLSRTVPSSGSELVDVVRRLVEEDEVSHASLEKAVTEVNQKKKLAFIAKKSTNNTPNDVTKLRGWIADASTREAQLSFSSSAAQVR